MYRWLVVVGALAGCGDNASGRPAVAGIRDGTRLVARYLAADGAAVFRIWHDTERGIDCAFQPASDGEYRCLPNWPDVTYANDEYADASCTQPVVRAPRCQAPRYAFGRAMATARCNKPSGRAVFAVGPARASRTVFVYRAGVCQEAFTIGAADALYDLGDKLPATDFVAAQLGPASSDALAPYTFTADDGAIQADAVWDAVRGGECGGGGRAEPPRCRPSEVALHYDFVWADAACSIQAAVDLSQNRPCATPTAIVGFGAGPNLRELGARVPAADVHHTNMDNVCTLAPPQMTSDPNDFYLEGAAILDDTLPVMSRVLDGAGRVRAERYADAAGHPLAASRGFYDTVVDEHCYPSQFLDGTVRCVPNSTAYADAAGSGGIYADAACTQPIAAYDAAAPPMPAIVVTHAPRDACDAVLYDATHAAGAPYTGALFGGRDCTPLERNALLTYYTLGAAIELPLITEL